jgi:PAS domain S-box-containing protein
MGYTPLAIVFASRRAWLCWGTVELNTPLHLKDDRPGGELPLFAGGGEMGALMRACDWSCTPLGSPDTWPQSLKTAVRIMLTSHQPIWIGWGTELTYLYNDAYKPIIGGKHPWALGKPLSMVWREIWADVRPMLSTTLKGLEGTYVEAQLLIMDRHGYPEETYYTFSFSPLPHDDGGVGGIICTNTDDTRRVIGERQLALLRRLAVDNASTRTWEQVCARSIESFRSNPQDVPFAMIYTGESGSSSLSLAGLSGFTRGHRAAPYILSTAASAIWPVGEALHSHAIRVVPDTSPIFRDSPPTSIWSRPPTQAAVVPIPSIGEAGRVGVLIVGLSPFRLFDEDYKDFLSLVAGQIGAALANAQLYEEERRRAEALAEIDRAKTAFFSNVSHEFRTPLTLMLGPLEETLRRYALPEVVREELTVVHRNALRLLKLVNSLLDFSRVEAGRLQAVYQAADLSAMTAELASMFQSACQKAGLRLTIHCPTLPEPVYVDRDMWEKIVLNLLSNAFKFTFEGEIMVAMRALDNEAELTVQDTGVGIPAHEMPRLFERFHRIEGTQGRTHEGTGIGLALVQELARLHGGTIEATSIVGEGTAFKVRIPFGIEHLSSGVGDQRAASPAAMRAEAYVAEALRWLPSDTGGARSIEDDSSSATVDLDASRSASGQRIILADDNADMRDYVRRLLLAEGYSVEVVTNGEEALAAAQRLTPALVLTDIMMPGLDGFGLLRALRADPTLRETPVVLVSAKAGEEARIEGLEAGADDYVTKPFSARELLAHVSANLALARVRRETAAALRESEARFRTMADSAPVMIWTTDQYGHCTYINQAWHEFTGQASVEDYGWIEPVHPEDRDTVRQMFVAAQAKREVIRLEYRLRRHDDVYRWVIDAASPRFGQTGEFLGCIGSVIDITERKEAEDRQALLIHELHHRMKNSLASVQSIMNFTLRTSDSMQSFQQAMASRIASLAKTHTLLIDNQWGGADLRQLLASELAPYDDGRRLSLEGPDVFVSADAAMVIGMALHELTTNAVKYGALSSVGGQVTIRWTLEPAEDGALAFHLIWGESGGPTVAQPTKRGFGSILLERLLAHQVGGKVDVSYQADGVIVQIHAKLPAGTTFSTRR